MESRVIKTYIYVYKMQQRITELANEIYDQLGPGYSESVYHNAFELKLRTNNIPYETERIVPIYVDDIVIGNLRADLIIDKWLVVELKATRTLNEMNRIQALNYLKLLKLNEALLINFQQSDNGKLTIVEVSS
jgi:GxxExxY protein